MSILITSLRCMQREAATMMCKVNVRCSMEEPNLSGFLDVLQPPPAFCCSVHGANSNFGVF